jgi:DNA invertase Pin-like site-specific DNA recombinase
MALIGYARISTSKQTLDQQTDALDAAGVERTFSDKLSGARNDRPGLAALMDYAREGDVVVVVALDRLGRSLSGVISTIDSLRKRGILLRSLREGIDTSTSAGRMVAGIFATLAEYERELINERSAVAREAAAARGKQTGRPRAMTPHQVGIARRMRENGESIADIVDTLKVSRATIYRVLQAADAADVEQLAKVSALATA